MKERLPLDASVTHASMHHIHVPILLGLWVYIHVCMKYRSYIFHIHFTCKMDKGIYKMDTVIHI